MHITPNIFAGNVRLARKETLRQAVRLAFSGTASVIASGLIGAPSAAAGPFPPVVPLATLYPTGGGDGSRGFVLTGVTEYDTAGSSVAVAGDVNGDGIDDLIIGAHAAGYAANSAGESYVVFGSAQIAAPVFPLATLYPDAGGDGSRGFVVAGLQAANLSHAFLSSDAAVRGKGSRGLLRSGIDVYDYSGVSVSGAGDINGDGIADLIIGVERDDAGGHSAAGQSYLIFGSTQGFPPVLLLATLLPAGGG